MEFINSSNTEEAGKNINLLPLPTKLKLLALKSIQTKIQSLNNEFQSEVTEVLQKYNAQSDSIALNSNDVIEAKLMPNLEGTRNLGDYFSNSEIIRAQEIPLTSKTFENYWFTCLINSKLQVAITPAEEEILLTLERVIMSSFVSKRNKSYKIAFLFRENAFFSNKEIICNIKYDHDNNLIEAKSNKILWYPGQNVYKNSAKSTNNAGGFFKVFKRFQKDAQNELLRKYKIDISFIASELIHEIIPNSFHYYLGVGKPSGPSKEKQMLAIRENKLKDLTQEILTESDSPEQINNHWIALKKT